MRKKLFYVKLVHTIIWAIYVLIISYIVYAGIANKINLAVWIAIFLVVVEGIVLMLFKGKCPLTILGYRYTEDCPVGFDIYLPGWLAKYNKLIFTSIYAIGVILVLYRVFCNVN